ncbi:fibropellin-1-like [Strongylocentrotus purpuratus]|uniref:Uncharacterized protein n=1 Tax=Strongylocentrotus purpuratus TaxID=7668 RepID=A0A7M7P7U8_STRPU|nr:fibropellin-1-like [Strongylocentrotus purpuratus]
MPVVRGLFALILGSSVFFPRTDSALPGDAGCAASIICPIVFDEMTNTEVQLVPKLVLPSSSVMSNLMESAGVSGGNKWTCSYPDIDDCASSPCSSRHRCIDGERSYKCECIAGYAGPNCEVDINECASNPCQNGGTCVDKLNRYSCSCHKGFDSGQCQTRKMYKSTTCEDDIITLDCGQDNCIHIVDANFGRISGAQICSTNRTLTVDCFADSLLAVRTSCEGVSSCTMTVNTATFGDPCFSIPKYLTIKHQCLCGFHTNDSGTNHNYHWLFPVSRIQNGEFKFLVRADNDVHVGLANRASLYGEYVEFAFCGWDNSAAGIKRDCVDCLPVIKVPGTLCQTDAFTDLWITFADGLYQVGLADQTEPFIQWQDPNPFDVTHLGVFSGYGSDADWMFYSHCIP